MSFQPCEGFQLIGKWQEILVYTSRRWCDKYWRSNTGYKKNTSLSNFLKLKTAKGEHLINSYKQTMGFRHVCPTYSIPSLSSRYNFKMVMWNKTEKKGQL